MSAKTTFLNLIVSVSLLACSTLNAGETPGRSLLKGLFSDNEEQQQMILLKAGFKNESELTKYLIDLKSDNDGELTTQLQEKFPGFEAIDELIIIIEKLQKQSRKTKSPSAKSSTNSGAPADQKIGENPIPQPHPNGLPEPIGAPKGGQKKPFVIPEVPTKKPKKSGNYLKKITVLSTLAVTGYLTYRYIQERSENSPSSNKIN